MQEGQCAHPGPSTVAAPAPLCLHPLLLCTQAGGASTRCLDMHSCHVCCCNMLPLDMHTAITPSILTCTPLTHPLLQTPLPQHPHACCHHTHSLDMHHCNSCRNTYHLDTRAASKHATTTATALTCTAATPAALTHPTTIPTTATATTSTGHTVTPHAPKGCASGVGHNPDRGAACEQKGQWRTRGGRG